MTGNTAKRTYKVAGFPAMPQKDTPNVYPTDPDWKLQAEARNLEHRNAASLESSRTIFNGLKRRS